MDQEAMTEGLQWHTCRNPTDAHRWCANMTGVSNVCGQDELVLAIKRRTYRRLRSNGRETWYVLRKPRPILKESIA